MKLINESNGELTDAGGAILLLSFVVVLFLLFLLSASIVLSFRIDCINKSDGSQQAIKECKQ